MVRTVPQTLYLTQGNNSTELLSTVSPVSFQAFLPASQHPRGVCVCVCVCKAHCVKRCVCIGLQSCCGSSDIRKVCICAHAVSVCVCVCVCVYTRNIERCVCVCVCVCVRE